MNTIKFDGRLSSSLNWKFARKQAQKLAEQNKPILWEIDLGLFDHLPNPIDDQSQFLSLTLSLEHFRDGLWNEFKDKTKGLCLYRGSADFSRKFKWDKTQLSNFVETMQERYQTLEAFTADTHISLSSNIFEDLTQQLLEASEPGRQLLCLFCRDTCVEYIQLLANRLPDGLKPFVILDAANLETPLREAQLLSRDRFEQLTPIIQNGTLPHENKSAKIGILLPCKDSRNIQYGTRLNDTLNILISRQIPFRVIPEHFLNLEWEGLDSVIAQVDGLTTTGWRQVQGFIAAGGELLSMAETIHRNID